MTFAEEAEMKDETQGLKRTLKDLFAGAVGGVAQVLLGTYHFIPFGVLCLEVNSAKGEMESSSSKREWNYVE